MPHLVAHLVSSHWFWLELFLAVIGGIIYFWGHWIEKRAARFLPPESFKNDIFGDIVLRYKTEMERGWKILMSGIAFEVIAAFGITVHSGLVETESKERYEILVSTNLMLQSNVAVLEAAVQWREINPEQEAIIVNLLSQFTKTNAARTNTVIVRAAYPDNPECVRYAQRIDDLLRKCGFSPFLQLSGFVGGLQGEGIAFSFEDKTKPPAQAQAIVEAFQTAKISPLKRVPNAANAANDNSDSLMIWILLKPERYLHK